VWQRRTHAANDLSVLLSCDLFEYTSGYLATPTHRYGTQTQPKILLEKEGGWSGLANSETPRVCVSRSACVSRHSLRLQSSRAVLIRHFTAFHSYQTDKLRTGHRCNPASLIYGRISPIDLSGSYCTGQMMIMTTIRGTSLHPVPSGVTVQHQVLPRAVTSQAI